MVGEAALIGRQPSEAAPSETSSVRRAGRLLANRDVAIVLVALAIFVVFSIIAPNFLAASVMIDLARRSAILGILSVGMTFLFVAGEFDLSIGSHYGFLLILLAKLTENLGLDPWVASLLILLAGTAIGAVNGILVTRIGLPSFIATLGMLILLRGATQTLSSGYPIPAKNTGLAFYQSIRANFAGTDLPNVFVLMLVIVAIGGLILAKTKFGSDVYSTGGNQEAARNTGIDTRRVKFICFVGMGTLVGLCSALLYGRVGLAPLGAGNNLELQVIAAVIIGGTSLFGGRGTVFGSLMGVFILGMITSGIILSGISQFWDGVGTAVVILIAAELNILVQRASDRLVRREA
ncbi:MAG: ABC transporter permease [Methylobacteriaceae bacterium]|nr:ABC transporter permease [Methylobacteriaceae bacterium]MBV9244857.1 ABC transporter permease [Methylobacteriaceae bacterium]